MVAKRPTAKHTCQTVLMVAAVAKEYVGQWIGERFGITRFRPARGGRVPITAKRPSLLCSLPLK